MSTWDGLVEWVSRSVDKQDNKNDWLGWDAWLNFRKRSYTQQLIIEISGDNHLLKNR